MDYINKGLKDTPFTGQNILNFLYYGPEEDRDQDMPNFDWRNIFNVTDQVIRLINRYGEVSLMHKKITHLLELDCSIQYISAVQSAVCLHFLEQ